MGRETSAPDLPIIDHRNVDWTKVAGATYALQQTFCYQYPGPINDLRQRLVVVPPPTRGDQQLLTYTVEASTPAARRAEHVDQFGNHVVAFHAPRIEREIGFDIWVEVERRSGDQPPLESVEVAARYLQPTPLTTPSPELIDAGNSLELRQNQSATARALTITRWVHEVMRYAYDATTVETTSGEAYAVRAGVCQDYAHIMIALCRLHGIPARYVSGHLLGEGGSHAWVEILAPSHETPGMFAAHAFDPTHGAIADLRYVTVAAGRDYNDVAPVSGAFRAPYGGTLRATKRATITHLRYGDGLGARLTEEHVA